MNNLIDLQSFHSKRLQQVRHSLPTAGIDQSPGNPEAIDPLKRPAKERGRHANPHNRPKPIYAKQDTHLLTQPKR
jgi:hypothetical protein